MSNKLLTMIEKYQNHYSIRIRTGENTGYTAGSLIGEFKTLDEAKQWVIDQDVELVTIVSMYAQIEIVKGWSGKFYAFNLNGDQCCTSIVFRSESHVKEIIDWHLECKAKGFV